MASWLLNKNPLPVAPATYVGMQPGFRHIAPVELYNLTLPIGIHPAGSTVSRATLERHGYYVPARTASGLCLSRVA